MYRGKELTVNIMMDDMMSTVYYKLGKTLDCPPSDLYLYCTRSISYTKEQLYHTLSIPFHSWIPLWHMKQFMLNMSDVKYVEKEFYTEYDMFAIHDVSCTVAIGIDIYACANPDLFDHEDEYATSFRETANIEQRLLLDYFPVLDDTIYIRTKDDTPLYYFQNRTIHSKVEHDLLIQSQRLHDNYPKLKKPDVYGVTRVTSIWKPVNLVTIPVDHLFYLIATSDTTPLFAYNTSIQRETMVYKVYCPHTDDADARIPSLPKSALLNTILQKSICATFQNMVVTIHEDGKFVIEVEVSAPTSLKELNEIVSANLEQLQPWFEYLYESGLEPFHFESLETSNSQYIDMSFQFTTKKLHSNTDINVMFVQLNPPHELRYKKVSQYSDTDMAYEIGYSSRENKRDLIQSLLHTQDIESYIDTRRPQVGAQTELVHSGTTTTIDVKRLPSVLYMDPVLHNISLLASMLDVDNAKPVHNPMIEGNHQHSVSIHETNVSETKAIHNLQEDATKADERETSHENKDSINTADDVDEDGAEEDAEEDHDIGIEDASEDEEIGIEDASEDEEIGIEDAPDESAMKGGVPKRSGPLEDFKIDRTKVLESSDTRTCPNDEMKTLDFPTPKIKDTTFVCAAYWDKTKQISNTLETKVVFDNPKSIYPGKYTPCCFTSKNVADKIPSGRMVPSEKTYEVPIGLPTTCVTECAPKSQYRMNLVAKAMLKGLDMADVVGKVVVDTQCVGFNVKGVFVPCYPSVLVELDAVDLPIAELSTVLTVLNELDLPVKPTHKVVENGQITGVIVESNSLVPCVPQDDTLDSLPPYVTSIVAEDSIALSMEHNKEVRIKLRDLKRQCSSDPQFAIDLRRRMERKNAALYLHKEIPMTTEVAEYIADSLKHNLRIQTFVFGHSFWMEPVPKHVTETEMVLPYLQLESYYESVGKGLRNKTYKKQKKNTRRTLKL
jgi:hypothetical protein